MIVTNVPWVATGKANIEFIVTSNANTKTIIHHSLLALGDDLTVHYCHVTSLILTVRLKISTKYHGKPNLLQTSMPIVITISGDGRFL
jgi:hypothetical protein